jgi:hypothetical protein
MAFSVAAKNSMLDYGCGSSVVASLHSSDPGDNGTLGELSGGTPVYVRQLLNLAPAAKGSKLAINQPTFNVPAVSRVSYVGFWSSVGGIFLGSCPIEPVTFTAQGTYTLETVSFSFE